MKLFLLGIAFIASLGLVACEEGIVTEVNGVTSDSQCRELANGKRYYYARIQKTCSYSN
jgi:hypothetical protein